MRLSIVTNFKKDFIPTIAKYNTVKEIYGKLSGDFIGGGRSSYMFSHAGKKNVEQHVRQWEQIEKLMNWLSKIKVDVFTVIKSQQKHFISHQNIKTNACLSTKKFLMQCSTEVCGKNMENWDGSGTGKIIRLILSKV